MNNWRDPITDEKDARYKCAMIAEEITMIYKKIKAEGGSPCDHKAESAVIGRIVEFFVKHTDRKKKARHDGPDYDKLHKMLCEAFTKIPPPAGMSFVDK
jgi:hypothetical protein